MSAWLIVKEVLDIIVYGATIVAVVSALLSQMQSHKKILAILGDNNLILLKWHRRAGWITLGIFMLSRVINMLFDPQSYLPMQTQFLAHGILIAPCALAVLNKIWIKRRKVGIKRTLSLNIKFLLIGASFFALTCMLAAWRWSKLVMTWDQGIWLDYQAAVMGHIVLAISLMWLGHSQLAKRNISRRIGNLTNNDDMSEYKLDQPRPFLGWRKFSISLPLISRRKL